MGILQAVRRKKNNTNKKNWKKNERKCVCVYVCHVHASAKPRSNLCSVFMRQLGCTAFLEFPDWTDFGLIFWYFWGLFCNVCAIFEGWWRSFACIGPRGVSCWAQISLKLVLVRFGLVWTLFLTSKGVKKNAKKCKKKQVFACKVQKTSKHEKTANKPKLSSVVSQHGLHGLHGVKTGLTWTWQSPKWTKTTRYSLNLRSTYAKHCP